MTIKTRGGQLPRTPFNLYSRPGFTFLLKSQNILSITCFLLPLDGSVAGQVEYTDECGRVDKPARVRLTTTSDRLAASGVRYKQSLRPLRPRTEHGNADRRPDIAGSSGTSPGVELAVSCEAAQPSMLT